MSCFKICILSGLLSLLASTCLWTEEKKEELTKEAVAAKFADKNLSLKDRGVSASSVCIGGDQREGAEGGD